MTSSPEYAKLSRVVQNFFTKTAQVIAQARVVQHEGGAEVASDADPAAVNKWFNLEIEELAFLNESLEVWRTATPSELPPPLVVECYLDPSKLRPGQTVVLAGSRCNTNQEIVLERWIVECKPPAAAPPAEDLPLTYKRAIVTMRSLFTVARLLPAWQLRQKLKRQRLTEMPLRLGIRIHNGALPISSRGRVGLSRSIAGKSSKLQQFQMQPVVTPVGSFQISVSYRVDVAFGVEDIETVMAQKFMELDHPGHGSTISTAAGSYGSHSSHNSNVGSQGSSIAQRPVLSFTRPFRSTEEGGAASHIGPQSIAGSASSIFSSNSRFSSSFASHRAPIVQQHRSLSQESRAARPLSVHSQLSQISHTSHTSLASQSSAFPSADHDSGGSFAQSDVGDFMKFVEDTRRRAERIGNSGADLDSTLARFQGMRASYGQLSSSFMQDSTPRSAQDSSQMSQASLHDTSDVESGTARAGSTFQPTLRPERRVASGLRSRLGFYSEAADDDADGDSDMLFTLSDMQL